MREVDQAIRITDRAYRILIDTPDSLERKKAIKDAALSPKWYQAVFEKWGVDPPASTRSTLILQEGFIPTTVWDSFLNGYKQTIQFAGLTEKDAGGIGVALVMALVIGPISQRSATMYRWESKGLLGLPEAKRFAGFTPDGHFGFVEGSMTGLPISELIPADPPEGESSTTPSTKIIGGTRCRPRLSRYPRVLTVSCSGPVAEITAEAFEDFFRLSIGRIEAEGAAGSQAGRHPQRV